jgi:hypothetical protein
MPEEALLSLAAPQAVERLGRGLAAVERGAQREVYLVERVRELPVTHVVKIVACAQREAVRGVVDARLLIETFAGMLAAERLDPQTRGALMAAAVMLNEDAVVPLLGPRAENDSDGPKNEKAKRGSLADAGETLGRRKSLGRTATGDLLLRILDDPHPEVVKNALMNPSATESHAVRVAARRPAPPAVLEVVAKSRFGNRHPVRRALAMNPDTPAKIACTIVATMTRRDLEDVALAFDLLPEVRHAVKRLLDG